VGNLPDTFGFLRGATHTPKNLAMALAGEAGELLEIFQWLTPEQSASVTGDSAQRRAVEDELADVLQYVVRLGDLLGIDLGEAVWPNCWRTNSGTRRAR
jgi:NTP pyrophosphatase (non-canonical NTP hydrolase)